MNATLIVLPAFNEEQFIGPVIKDIKMNVQDIDILVIDDGSKDQTRDIASNLGVKVISHPYNLGYGAALQTGFLFAVKRGYEAIITLDADGQHDPKSIEQLLEACSISGADVVIGSRFIEHNYKVSMARRIGIWIFASVARLYTGYKFTDPTSGFQLLKRRAFSFLAEEDTYPLDYPDVNIIVLLHKKRFQLIETSVKMRSNIRGDTMHSGLRPVMYIIRMMLAIIVILLRKED